MTTRRTVLSILGLAPLSVPAAVDFSTPIGVGTDAGDYHYGRMAAEKAIKALRSFADAIERGETSVQGLRVNSEVKPDDFLVHTLSIDFLILERA